MGGRLWILPSRPPPHGFAHPWSEPPQEEGEAAEGASDVCERSHVGVHAHREEQEPHHARCREAHDDGVPYPLVTVGFLCRGRARHERAPLDEDLGRRIATARRAPGRPARKSWGPWDVASAVARGSASRASHVSPESQPEAMKLHPRAGRRRQGLTRPGSGVSVPHRTFVAPLRSSTADLANSRVRLRKCGFGPMISGPNRGCDNVFPPSVLRLVQEQLLSSMVLSWLLYIIGEWSLVLCVNSR